jgi:hypothetical protein
VLALALPLLLALQVLLLQQPLLLLLSALLLPPLLLLLSALLALQVLLLLLLQPPLLLLLPALLLLLPALLLLLPALLLLLPALLLLLELLLHGDRWDSLFLLPRLPVSCFVVAADGFNWRCCIPYAWMCRIVHCLLLSLTQLLQQAGQLSCSQQRCNRRQRQHTLNTAHVACGCCGCEPLLLQQLQQRLWLTQQCGDIVAACSCCPQPERRHSGSKHAVGVWPSIQQQLLQLI